MDEEKNIKILTIDDEKSIRESFKNFLEDYNFEVFEAGNGKIGLEINDKEKPDLILVDLRMPEVDGLDVLEKVTKTSPDTPIIVVSGTGVINDVIEALHLGAWDYLLKPIEDLSVLMHAVNKCLERAKLLKENKKYQEHLESEILERTQELRESEQTYHEIFNSTNEAFIVLCAESGNIIDVNKAMLELFGYSYAEILKLSLTDLSAGNDFSNKEEILIKVKQTFETGSQIFEWNAKTRDNKYFWVEINLKYTKIRGRSRILAVIRDITKHKQAEDAIRKLNEELELRVKDRTAELQATNVELKEFAYVVSHDLKAPLRAVSQLANWISQDYADAFDQEGKEQMELLIGRVKRMDGLINGILQYSRVGRVKNSKEEIDIDELVSEIIKALAHKENIQITIADKLPVIKSERMQIIQVFQNLLSNAIKFSDKPEGIINIGCSETDSYWEFYVSDNGPGIEEKFYNRIFQIFQTLTSRDEIESTGIGLTLVKKIVELFGGTIRVNSKVGEGTIFYFTIPK